MARTTLAIISLLTGIFIASAAFVILNWLPRGWADGAIIALIVLGQAAVCYVANRTDQERRSR